MSRNACIDSMGSLETRRWMDARQTLAQFELIRTRDPKKNQQVAKAEYVQYHGRREKNQRELTEVEVLRAPKPPQKKVVLCSYEGNYGRVVGTGMVLTGGWDKKDDYNSLNGGDFIGASFLVCIADHVHEKFISYRYQTNRR